ncbi:hypothetical protein [Streptomyces sp. NPDC059176]|uniref:hypothetical protein n=1 Tax=unclassified Streptomyces TaxID=2593676 RepID=UPI003673E58D
MTGQQPEGVRHEIAAIIDRHARTAIVMGEFRRRLLTESKRTPFPAAEIERIRGAAVTASH